MTKAFIYTLSLCMIAALSSCVTSYDVQGSSSVADIDGRMLYLKGMQNDELLNMDSCDVIHGEFHFVGNLDSVSMANLFMGDEWLMPVVLEEGPITIRISLAQQRVSGTPLNDKLYRFLDKKMQLQNELEELSHRETQAIMNGEDINAVHSKLAQEAQSLAMQLDRLETKFITDNFDNILGPSVFESICSAYQYPVLTPQIEEIMSKATDKFKSNAFVREYYRIAQENLRLMQGYNPEEAKAGAARAVDELTSEPTADSLTANP